MMAVPTRMGVLPLTTENNPLGLSWHDSAWIPLLNPTNIMDYFSERSNPFYDRTCNNEIVKMQRLSPEQLNNMTGLEYILLHVQDPILYVIRKQHRHSATQATPLADYYIIAGTVYQAPDLASVLNSRLLSTVHHLQSSFDEASSYSRYHPSKGYTWDFKPNKLGLDRNIPAQPTKKETTAVKEEPSSLFQRQRVDMLLGELTRKFPIPMPPSAAQNVTNGATIKTENVNEKPASEPPVTIKQEPVDNVVNGNINDNPGSNSNLLSSTEVKTEPNEVMKPPPEKKQRLN